MTIDSSTPPPPHKKEVEHNAYSSPSLTPQQQQQQKQQQQAGAAVMAGDDDESSPLMMKRHISMTDEEDGVEKVIKDMEIERLSGSKIPYIILAMVALAFYALARPRRSPRLVVTPIEEAVEHTIDVGNNTTIWFRTWGKHPKNYLSADMYVPALLFVHGGPGQAVADYNDGNKRFFDKESMFVVEVDQRGTGNSQPSVRDDYRNMKHYMDISIDLIAKDFELVRSRLGIEEWVVWGGSYGSTIALNYCMLYPKSCTALLLRGIYLDTKKELSEVYSRRAFEDDKRKLKLFDNLYELAQMEVKRVGGDNATELDPNDYERLLQVYESMITRGDRAAIWRWTAFENNLMEDRPKMQLDPNHIIEEKFAEAQSVAFFETRLWLHETFEDPSNLLAAERLARLRNIPIWICQGVYDNVCPVQNAWSLVSTLKRANHRHSRDDPGLLQAYFLDANHEDTDPVMESCLMKIMDEFLSRYTR